MYYWIRYLSLYVIINSLIACTPSTSTTSNPPLASDSLDQNASKKVVLWTRTEALSMQAAFDKEIEEVSATTKNKFKALPTAFHRCFKDQFKRLGPWPEIKNNTCELNLTSAGYALKHKIDSAAYHIFVPLEIDSQYNWAIESKINVISLDSTSLFGLHIGYDEQLQLGTFFRINPLIKKLTIMNCSEDSILHFLNQKNFKIIKDSMNTLRVESYQKFWFYYLNDTLVYCHPAKPLESNKFGYTIDGRAHLNSAYFQIQW